MHGTRKQKQRLIATLAALAGISIATHCQAQTSDALLDKLVQKGVLTQDEAQDLREESDKDFALAHAVKTGMPEWVNALRINGDWRARYDNLQFPHDQNPQILGAQKLPDRHRFRQQLRIGFTAVMAEQFEVGIRLGSGDLTGGAPYADPTTYNNTFRQNGSKKPVYIDLGYAKWTPINDGKWTVVVTGGKMENPFTFSDALFDYDYTPEGAAEQVTYTFSDAHQLKLIAGQYILDEQAYTSKAPYLLGEQAKWDAIWNSRWSSSLSAGFFSIQQPALLSPFGGNEIVAPGATPTGVPPSPQMIQGPWGGNERNPIINQSNGGFLVDVGAPESGFGTLAFNASVTYTRESMPFYNGPFPIRPFAEYMENLDAAEEAHGIQAGIVFGKAGKRGTWEASYRFKYEEGNVWYEALTDSDFGGFYQANPLVLNTGGPAPASSLGGLPVQNRQVGYLQGTNVKGHVMKFAYSPYDFLTLSATLYSTTLIRPDPLGSSSHVNRLLVDAMWRF